MEKVYDVCVYGAGASAAAAAVGLVRRNRSVLLVSPNGFVASESGNSFLTDFPKGICETADGLIQVMRQCGGYRGTYADPAILQLKILSALEGADILYYARPAGVVTDGDRVKGLLLAEKNGIACVRAKCFIDASDDLEIFHYAQNDLRSLPREPEHIFLFNMELDSDGDDDFDYGITGVCRLKENRDVTVSRSVWDTERTFKIANGSRQDLRRVLTEVRSLSPLYADALLSRASNSICPLKSAVICGMPRYRNLFASGDKAQFTFRDHAALIPTRMLEGEKLAEEADSAIPACPVLPVSPEDICVRTSPVAESDYDVLVCGGGTAGASAAIAAARKGMKTLLWENMDYLGGIGTGGAIPGYYYGLPGGMQDEIDLRVREMEKLFCGRHIVDPDMEKKRNFSRFNPFAKMVVLEEMAKEAGVTIEFGITVCGVETELIKPPQFPVFRGTPQPPEVRSLKSVSGYSAKGVRQCRAKVFIDSTGDGDIAVLAGAPYTAGREPDAVQHIFSVPALTLQPMTEQEGDTVTRSYFIVGCFNIDAGYADACDAEDVSRARRAALAAYDRKKFEKFNRILTYSTVLGVRESRQIIGDYRLTLGDQIRSAEFPDVIAYSTSHYDNHANDYENESMNALLWTWALDGHWVAIGSEIPYRTMLPLGVENLILACRALSLDYDASQQFRMQRDMQRIGEAAGIAASIAVRDHVPPRYIDIRKVQLQLTDTKALTDPESNCHSDSWKPENYYPEKRIFELTEQGYAPSRNLLPDTVSAYRKLESSLQSSDPAEKYSAAVALAAGAKLDKANALMTDCIRYRCDYSTKKWGARPPLWKIAIAVCGANRCTDARKSIEDILTDEHCLKDQQALILAIRTLGVIGDRESAKAIHTLLRRGDVAHTQEFPYWTSENVITEDTTWKLDLAGFEAMYRLGMEQKEFLEPYKNDPRGYVRRAAERVSLRVYGK